MTAGGLASGFWFSISTLPFRLGINVVIDWASVEEYSKSNPSPSLLKANKVPEKITARAIKNRNRRICRMFTLSYNSRNVTGHLPQIPPAKTCRPDRPGTCGRGHQKCREARQD